MAWSIFEYGNQEALTHLFGRTILNDQPVHDIHHVWGALVVLGLAVGMGLSARRSIARSDNPILPSDRFNFRNILELFLEIFYDFTRDIIGKDARKYFPWIASFALFIFLSNAFSLVPGLLPPTDMLTTTLALGLCSFILYNYYGIKKHGIIKHLKHFAGPLWWLAPLMIPIEIISHFARPLSLALRLMGNIAGDHLVLGIFLSFGFAAFLVPLPIMFLGIIVVVVQTMVFTLLTIVYIAMAVEDSH